MQLVESSCDLSLITPFLSTVQYEAYCPEGEKTEPFGGVKANPPTNINWGPIINHKNYWVALGGDVKCVLYTNLYPDAPAWGITGENNEGETRHVMCCSRYSSVAVHGLDEDLGSGGEYTAKDESPPPAPSPPIGYAEPVVPLSVPEQSSDSTKELELIYQQMDVHYYQPVGYDRNQGWEGKDYHDAFAFCAEQSNVPCSESALCPMGTGGEPLPIGFDIGYTDEIWVPVVDSGDVWVELRKGGYCAKHTTLDESKFEDVTRYALCCKKPGGGSSTHQDIPFEVIGASEESETSPISSSFGASSSWASQGELDDKYNQSETEFNPVGYDRSSGWDGQTYRDALLFCASKNSKIPCPYEALCPHGSDGPPVGGEKDGVNGVWVPIMDSANSWLQIGWKDTCMKYIDLKPHPPAWGLTGKDNEGITRHIKCCDEVGWDGPQTGKEEEEVSEITQLSKTEELVLDTMVSRIL